MIGNLFDTTSPHMYKAPSKKGDSMTRLLIAICAVSLTVSACGGNKYGGKELLVINGAPITEGYVEFLGTVNPRLKAQLGSPAGRKQLMDNIIEQELFYQAAAKKGLDHDPDVKGKADLYRRVIVAQAYVEKSLETEAQKYYNDHQSEFEKLRLSHILIKIKGATPSPAEMVQGAKPDAGHSDAEAKALAQKIEARLKNKEEFAAIAKEASEDVITKANGGDLGEVSQKESRMMRRGYEPLLEKAFGMKVGEVSEPIKLQDGYHIITVTRGIEVEPFESAKQGIMFRQQADLRNKLLADLKSNAKIEYRDAGLQTETPAVAGAVPLPADPYAK